ncbi:portal protein [Caulobacter sp. NIBR2454]|uniref:portal protein n=1 Tax=Caulobacter sp. NIBR2454 TaxID=3015996 RepID=UPI0022B69FAA|nr:hypothetical protein [Caulobacter sp. NIBR2454]
MDLTDEELLGLVGDEAKRSIGFDYDHELTTQRERALNYRKGVMPDLKALPNRSKAVSTDVADAIETILPDLIEIFTGGDDVVSFQPVGPEDEEGAEQETDYTRHVFFQRNNGWLNLYTAFKDACEAKTGILTWAWEEGEAEKPETFDDKVEAEANVIMVEAEERGGTVERTANEDGTINLTVTWPKKGRVKIYAVAPEDFTVAKDTTLDLQAATYCAMRSRIRAQQLIADGMDREAVERIPAYGASRDEQIDRARDTAGEDDETGHGGQGDMRLVEIVVHYIRRADEDGTLRIWRVVTGGEDTVLLDKHEVDQIPFSVFTPYIVTHRLHGESVADKLMEVQKIRTALLRMFLDSGYFALNQRYEVGSDHSNDWTVQDLLRNEPGVPVRSKTGTAVRAISAGALNFDPVQALEYMATVSEQRTGIVRNAQGLNPDTLHDTATGAAALMQAAQKRIKLIARSFAETGLKPAFLGIHALIRKHATAGDKFQLRQKWVDVKPTNWGTRNDMTIEVGNGASGVAQELQVLGNILGAQKELVAMQGGVQGPFVNAANLHHTLTRYVEKSGQKNPNLYFSDPNAPPDPSAPQPEPKPDPEMMKLQAQQEAEQAKTAGQLQLQREKNAAEIELQREKLAMEAEAERENMRHKHVLEMEQLREELAMEREKLRAQLATQREVELIKAANQHNANLAKLNTSVSQVEAGGQPG